MGIEFNVRGKSKAKVYNGISTLERVHWSCSLYDLLIIVLLLPALMVKHLSSLNFISQVFSQEPTESRSDWRSSGSFLLLMGR